MTHEEFFDRIDEALGPIGCRADDGEDYRAPPLDVIRYDLRAVRLHWMPVIGKALSVVAFVRQPIDLSSAPSDLRRLVERLGRAVHGRYPPWPRGGPGLVVGLTTVLISPEPIGPADEGRLAEALPQGRRSRIIPMSLIRVNLGQEAMAIAPGPDMRPLFPEPFAIADELSRSLGRFVPPLELD